MSKVSKNCIDRRYKAFEFCEVHFVYTYQWCWDHWNSENCYNRHLQFLPFFLNQCNKKVLGLISFSTRELIKSLRSLVWSPKIRAINHNNESWPSISTISLFAITKKTNAFSHFLLIIASSSSLLSTKSTKNLHELSYCVFITRAVCNLLIEISVMR